MSEQGGDHNHAATPYKLSKARDRGQVAKSADMTSAIAFTTTAIYANWQGWDKFQEQFRLDHRVFLQLTRISDPGQLWPLIEHVIWATMSNLAPVFGTLLLAAIIGNLIQTGPILSIDPITADFNRLNPVNGFKRIFSLRTIFDGGRSCIKLLLLATVAYFALKAMAPQFYHLSALSPVASLRTLFDDITGLCLRMAAVLSLLALIDVFYTRREFAKKMQMSAREIKDETKHREGDPRIRARLRELRREMLKRSKALSRTRDADLVLTNPTHLAVALQYVHGEMVSPRVLSKGAGRAAAVMRDIAARHGIPVVRNPQLARKLYSETDVDHHVPAHLYSDVARIVVWVFAMRDQQRRMRAGTAGVKGYV